MAKARLHHGGNEYHPRRVVCMTVLPSYEQTEYKLAAALEAKMTKLVEGLGPSCRVRKFQWLVATAAATGAIAQDLGHEGVDHVLVFAALIGTDWEFGAKPQSKTDDREFDGVGAFLQQQLG